MGILSDSSANAFSTQHNHVKPAHKGDVPECVLDILSSCHGKRDFRRLMLLACSSSAFMMELPFREGSVAWGNHGGGSTVTTC